MIKSRHSRCSYLLYVLMLVSFGVEPSFVQAQKLALDNEASNAAVTQLQQALERAPESDEWLERPFADVKLTKDDAARAQRLLWDNQVARIRSSRQSDMDQLLLTAGELKMPFYIKVFGEKPEGGRSLYISMHGGGGAPTRVNDRQWENQKRLYQLTEGVYVAPRAPTDTWNLWHQAHIDGLFSRLIENMIVFHDVDPNRVYLMGYSAGGDGVFQLAPRMADRFAAAAMMAGHPNETSPLGLRNLPFTLHMGGKDAAYNRNKIAERWKEQLDQLQTQDPDGYEHWVQIYPDKGHWMDREDAAAIGWMAKYTRRVHPKRIVWKQDDVRHSRFYWLAVDPGSVGDRAEIRAEYSGQQFTITTNETADIRIRLNDLMLDLDQPVTVTRNGRQAYSGHVSRTLKTLARTLEERRDPAAVYSAELTIPAP